MKPRRKRGHLDLMWILLWMNRSWHLQKEERGGVEGEGEGGWGLMSFPPKSSFAYSTQSYHYTKHGTVRIFSVINNAKILGYLCSKIRYFVKSNTVRLNSIDHFGPLVRLTSINHGLCTRWLLRWGGVTIFYLIESLSKRAWYYWLVDENYCCWAHLSDRTTLLVRDCVKGCFRVSVKGVQQSVLWSLPFAQLLLSIYQ